MFVCIYIYIYIYIYVCVCVCVCVFRLMLSSENMSGTWTNQWVFNETRTYLYLYGFYLLMFFVSYA